MRSKWLVLFIIIFMYLPVSLDATVLHIAIPTLSMSLAATGSELLWIIDIYSLVMAGLLLPMGALGDRLGFKKLAIIGLIIFGIASVVAALSVSAFSLIIARVLLAVGAAMILPATLSAVRRTFTDEKERSLALGIWTMVGVGGAALGPLIGGYLLEYFYWGSVFLINIPIVLVMIVATGLFIPKQPQNNQQPWQIGKALVLISSILMLVYAIKTGLRGDSSLVLSVSCGFIGLIMLIYFIRKELFAISPMIDFRLLTKREMIIGVVIAMTAMITIVGFELLMAQELQFVYSFTPLQAGVFMLPLMLASGFSGPIAGWLVSKLGLRLVATVGMGISATSFYGLAFCDFMRFPYVAWMLMIMLGFSAGTALLASTAAIMGSAPSKKAASAGAIEGMAYELGAGFGVVIFGMMLTSLFAYHIVVPGGISVDLAAQAEKSINEALLVADRLVESELSYQLIIAAKQAFSSAHSVVLATAGVMLSILTGFIWMFLPTHLPAEVSHH